MKMIEISYRSKIAELEKLNARLERAEKAYEKKLAAAQKVGIADWTNEQYRAWMDTVEVQNGFIVNKADIQKNGAWFDLHGAKRELNDIKDRITKAEARLEKDQQKIDEYHAEVARINDLKRKEELLRLEFEQEQKEWARDGITLTSRYMGYTPNGKWFGIDRNHGWTERSLHCYTLYIDGETIFTSGEFWRAYGVIKNS